MEKKISDEQKIYELSLIWSEAKYNFAFWDYLRDTVNWDEEYKKTLNRVLNTDDLFEYYQELQRFVNLLRDGHTQVMFPDEIIYNERYCSFLPICTEYIDDEIIITNCSKNVADKIKLFSKVKRINGEPTIEYIRKNIFPYLWHEKFDSCYKDINFYLTMGQINSVVSLELEESGKKYIVDLKRKKFNPNWVFKPINKEMFKLKKQYIFDDFYIEITDDDIAILTVKTFINDFMILDMYKHINYLKAAKAFIVDVRDNDGGSSANAAAVASMFIGREFPSHNWLMAVNKSTYMAWAVERKVCDFNYSDLKYYFDNAEFAEGLYKTRKHTYFEKQDSKSYTGVPDVLQGPVVVMLNERTASAAEDFLNMMRFNTKAVFIGNNSYGSTGIPLSYKLKSGGLVRICSRHSLLLNDEEFTNKGIAPDIIVKPTIESIKSGEDLCLERSLKEIRKMLSNK